MENSVRMQTTMTYTLFAVCFNLYVNKSTYWHYWRFKIGWLGGIFVSLSLLSPLSHFQKHHSLKQQGDGTAEGVMSSFPGGQMVVEKQ